MTSLMKIGSSIVALAIASSLNAGDGSMTTNFDQMIAASGPLFSWVTHGNVFYRSMNLGDGTFGVYFYKDVKGQWSILSGNNASVVNMINAELNEHADITEFINDTFPRLLLSMCGPPHSHFIDPALMKIYRNSLVKPTEKKTVDILARYEKDSELSVVANSWNLNVNVALQSGSIEHWAASGSVEAFSIEKFERTVEAPDGSFIPIDEIGDERLRR